MSVYRLREYQDVTDDFLQNLQPWDMISNYMDLYLSEYDIDTVDEIAMKLGATYKKVFYCDGKEHKDLFSIHYFKNRESEDGKHYIQVMSVHRYMNTITYQKEMKFSIELAHSTDYGPFIKLGE